MTWTTQTPINTVFSTQSTISSSWDADMLTQLPFKTQDNTVVTHPGPGLFNVVGQLFNQAKILFNHKVSMGNQDITFKKQNTNDVVWRTQV